MEMSNSSNAIGLKKNIRVDVKINDVKPLIEISHLMPKEVRSEFASKYGKILDLLHIPVDALGLSALAQYWNLNLRCFELPNLDTTPTVEEYAYMLRIPLPREFRVYFYYGQHVSDGKIAELLGVLPKPSDKMEKGDVRGLRRRFLEVYLQDLARQKNWVIFKRVLALTIYGLVLFPFIPDMVDYAAMDVYHKVEEYNVNPIPAILAETFLSLQVCHENQQGKLRCCAQMLYVWIVTHMYARKYISEIDDPLRRFHHIPIKPCKSNEWRQEFDEVDSKAFCWMCPWYKGNTVIFSCGNFSNIPLMGPRGCVSYSPALVIRQLKWTQQEPLEKVLGGISFLYQECEVVKNTTIAVRSAWSNIRVLGSNELGRQIISHTRNYEAWRKARKGNPVVSKPIPYKDENPQTEAEMLKKIEIMMAQMGVLEEKNETDQITIITLQHQVQKLNMRIEHLKDECADAYEAASPAKKAKKWNMKESEVRGLLARIEDQEKMLAQIFKEKEDLGAKVEVHVQTIRILEESIGSLKEALTHTERYSDEGWNAAATMRESLKKAQEKEQQLWMRVWMFEREKKQYEDEIRQQEEWLENWESVAKDLKADRDAWKKRYEHLSGSLQYHTYQFVGHLEEALVQTRMSDGSTIPPKIARFMKYCRGLASGFKRKTLKLLM